MALVLVANVSERFQSLLRARNGIEKIP